MMQQEMKIFGYVAGPGPNVDRIVYANDTATALERSTLVELGFDIAAAGNQNFGYFVRWISSKNSSKST